MLRRPPRRKFWGKAVRQPTVVKHTVSPLRSVPSSIIRPPYVNGSPPSTHPAAQIHGLPGIAAMRAACRVAADALRYAGTVIQPGITTDELDERVHNFIVDAGAYPSPLGYAGFPKSICTSINEVLCHGIPDR